MTVLVLEAVFLCACCERPTLREGLQPCDSTICEDCYELAGLYNTLQDSGPVGLLPYAGEIRRRTYDITRYGGVLDSDAKELLSAIGDSHVH